MPDSAKSYLSMVPQYGALAVVLAIAATVVGIKPSRPGDRPAAEAKEEAEPKAATAPKDEPKEPKTHLDKLAEFGILDQVPDGPRAASPPRLKLGLTVRFLVVTVPDPVETQFGTRFDQALDAVTRAMADVPPAAPGPGTISGHTLDRYWLPWQQRPKGAAPAGPPAYRSVPGVLVFRGPSGSPERVVVLLVGEGPLGGVHRESFQAALSLAVLSNTRSKPNTIRIVGPNFTGSQGPMAQAIEDWRKDPVRKGKTFQIVSGSAAGLLPSGELGKRAKSDFGYMDFWLTQAPTNVLNRAVLNYLARPGDTRSSDDLTPDLRDSHPPDSTGQTPPDGGAAVTPPPPRPDPNTIAFLIESSSGYGNAAAANAVPAGYPWVLRFPMHISRLAGLQVQHLREREEKLGLAPASGSDLKKLDERRRGEDALPPAEELRTALVNQRLLQDYWETIRRERVRYVGILASDVRDQIFLIGQLRRECPNVVVFTHGADLLLAHPENLAETRGVVVVSSYPLYPAAQEWAKWTTKSPPDRRRVPFASAAAEGTYNAVLIQCDQPDRVLDYRPPPNPDRPPEATVSTQNRPAVWVMTVADDGALVPLAFFANYKSDIVYPVTGGAAGPAPVTPPQTAPLRHLMLLFLAACLWGAVVIFRSFSDPPGGANPRLTRRLKYQYSTLIGVGLLFASLPMATYFLALVRQPGAGHYLWSPEYPFDGALFVVTLAAGAVFAVVGVAGMVSLLIPALERRDPFGAFAACLRGRRRPAPSGDANPTPEASDQPETPATSAGTGAPGGESEADGEGQAPCEQEGKGPSADPPPPADPPVTWAERLPLLVSLAGGSLVACVFTRVLVASVGKADPAGQLLFLERSAHLAGGCSPVLAGYLIALGLFVYGVIALKLLAVQTGFRVASPYPDMPADVPNPKKVVYDLLNRIGRQARRTDEAAFGLWTLLRRRWGAFLGVLTAAVVFLAGPPVVRAHPSWEGPAWDWAFLVGIAALFLLTVLSAFRLYAVWREVERLLRLIGRVPMVGAFDGLPDKVYRVLGRYLLGGRRRAEDILIPHSLLVRLERELTPDAPAWAPAQSVLPQAILDRLQNVRVSLEPAGVWPADQPAADGSGLAPAPAARRRPDGRIEPAADPDGSPVPRELSGAQASEFSAVSRDLVRELAPRWVGRPIPDGFGRRVDGTPAEAAPGGWQAVAEQFVAIQVVIFVAQYFHQLRYLAYLAALPAGALLVAVTSYPFMPERLIMYSAVGLVVAVLAVILWVIYRINKNGLVSRVTRTTPDRLSLDAGLFSNLVSFVLPLLLVAIVQVGGRWRSVAEPVLDLIR